MDRIVTQLGILNETNEQETRVALTPDVLKRLDKLGYSVVIESGAGLPAGYTDQNYTEHGAAVEADANPIWSKSDIVAVLNPPSIDNVRKMKQGAILLGQLWAVQNPDLMAACQEQKVTVMALEAVPRTSRAQSVDALSAMGNLAGYKSVLLGAAESVKVFPLMMTAAGTLQPARVFILGAGVAGLQAIATAKRLGAKVEAYDVRPAVKEQVESLGATFVEFDLGTAEGEGGYAREQTAEEQEKQRQAMSKVIAEADVVITTAAIPGRPAPKLVDEDQVKGMKPGSVIVDMAAATGGNCTLTEPGKTVKKHNISIVGPTNLPATMPFHASQTYAKIIQTLLSWMVDKEKNFNLNFEDDVIGTMTVVHEGEVRWDPLKEVLNKEGASA
ncbi:MAG: Re/Si-specific NAD(P)(+) transhydrogenase subunit alpha [Planctomycetes bacterium]|nr:Re/Si-specific NAD(P)(+) transhydrogenase subunit alpha [Planctomycetota bacterium]NOG55301.1 Re/Si-specific NAD(P)(+) transhydrogenase subunit alpha [Planctomycetota bacterium]